MKTNVLLIFLILSLSSFAQVKTSYFLYDDKKIKLDDRSFRRYILPQLRAISAEYYHILKKLHPIHESTIRLYKELSKIERMFKEFRNRCHQIDMACLEDLKGLYDKVRKLDNSILEPLNNEIDLTKASDTHEMEALLKLVSILGEMSNKNYRLLHALEEYTLTANTSFFPYYDGKSLIEPTIHKMLISSELILTQLLKDEIKEDFHAVWIHFIKDLDEKIIENDDKIYLIKRLEELNLSWNTFHMKMTKGNHQPPKNIVSIIKIMHNRWNSCLKIVLR